ncbi:MAG: sulfatase-like hydrolase/transferase [Deltaproteobacteria bacterium]|nr:sulfatase-like hydrolase/transferase [Deltaproteobacteria bacterium]
MVRGATFLFVAIAASAVPACSGHGGGDDDGPGTAPLGEPTDTVPSFYGKVPSNLLILSVDTFRRDRAGKYRPGAMPFLEQIMEEGFTLDNHMECANWTLMGTACSNNGRYNEDNGFVPELGNLLRGPLPDGPTLASTLADNGWYTILATGNSWFSAEWNNAQGFDEAELTGGAAVNIYGRGESMLSSAILRGEVGDGWMVHAHLMEPHAPYNPPADYLAGEASLPPIPWDLSVKDEHYAAGSEYPALTPDEQANLAAHMNLRYDGELAHLDDQFRTIWADLTARSLLEDTLVVIFNDHGEQIWEHGQESHAYSLYREENDGIAVFWAQNILPGAWTGPTSQIDLAPTIIALLGQEVPVEMTGVPVGESPEDRPLFALTSARNNTIQAVRQNEHKLIYTWATGGVELFDLEADPTEQNNVYDPTDPVALQLWDLLLPRIELTQPLIFDDAPTWPAGLPRPTDPTTPVDPEPAIDTGTGGT